MPGMEALRISFPFAFYGAAQSRAALRMLPQAHTCTNTLELPDYYAALQAAEVRVQSKVKRQQAQAGADGAQEGGNEDKAGSGMDGGAAAFRQRCLEVLRERIEYAVVHSAGVYGLDE